MRTIGTHIAGAAWRLTLNKNEAAGNNPTAISYNIRKPIGRLKCHFTHRNIVRHMRRLISVSWRASSSEENAMS